MTVGHGTSTIFLLVIATTIAGAEPAKVLVHITDAYGNSVPASKLTLTREGGPTIDVKQDEAFSAEYGRYTVNVSIPGFSNAVNEFLIDQPEQILLVTMKLGMMEVPPPRCSLGGQITPTGEIVRIRLLQLFGPYSVDIPVAADGSFRFQNLECGDYMLIAMDSKRCIASRMSRATTAGARADMLISDFIGGACSPSK